MAQWREHSPPPMWPRFNSRSWRHMWVEFVVGSHPCSEGFSPGTLVFLPTQKPTFQIPIRPGNSGEKSHSMDSTEIPIYLFIYLFIYLNSICPVTFLLVLHRCISTVQYIFIYTQVLYRKIHQLVKLIRNYTRDPSEIFSISSLVRISRMLFPTFHCCLCKQLVKNGE